MILLKSKEPWRCGTFTMAAGSYVVGESTASTALMMNPALDVQTIQPPPPMKPEPKTHLIVRSGGFGDLLFLTPAIRSLKLRFPDRRITVACWPHCACIFDGNPHVDKVLDYPPRAESLPHYDVVTWLEDAMEWEAESRTKHVVDIYAEKLASGLAAGGTLEYDGHRRHLEAMRARFPKKQEKRIGIQLSASARCRTYPAKLMEHMIDLLYADRHQYEIALFDVPRADARGARKVPRVLNLCGEEPPLSFAESTAALADCDAVIAPDSALCHIAGALKIPTLALYGPFPSALRTAYAPSIRAIDGTASCAPCFHHERESIWPEKGECRKSGRCEALARIAPERIVREVRKMLMR